MKVEIKSQICHLVFNYSKSDSRLNTILKNILKIHKKNNIPLNLKITHETTQKLRTNDFRKRKKDNKKPI